MYYFNKLVTVEHSKIIFEDIEKMYEIYREII